ncbi:TorD/DmsD family molecular chaperone [Vibrio gallicus]|uniref:TorD/DmsD family molecular chaperone n=1 Tax=Vibrio gallicus TaxID=190897 RepID=UPI0021C2DE0D|nr:molecular chaperone TorD family protein [Vibrio gallicus]
MLANFYRGAPTPEVLNFLATLEIEPENSAMNSAWKALSHAALATKSDALQDEYQQLFIGIGRGEVVPFGSWHQTGSLMEKPLALVRHDLQRLGFEREEQVKEPEDHISALCEVMAYLLEDHTDEAQGFFNHHIAPWFSKLNTQTIQANATDFYGHVSRLMVTFFDIEQVRFSEVHMTNLSLNTINVKNVTG